MELDKFRRGYYLKHVSKSFTHLKPLSYQCGNNVIVGFLVVAWST